MKAPSPKYLGPANRHGGSNNKPIHRIVIHSTVSPCVKGGARNIAGMFRSTTRAASAHYVVDPGEVVQVVYDSTVAYHAPPNEHSIGIEMCDMPSSASGKRWNDNAHKAMLRRVAKLTAQLCLSYDVPMRKRSPGGLRSGAQGICGHIDVSNAWHQTSHWDPGRFPWRRFVRMVRSEAKALQGSKRAPKNPKRKDKPVAKKKRQPKRRPKNIGAALADARAARTKVIRAHKYAKAHNQPGKARKTRAAYHGLRDAIKSLLRINKRR